MVETVTSMFENEGAYTDPEARVVVHCPPPAPRPTLRERRRTFMRSQLPPNGVANLQSILSSWRKMGTGFTPHTAAYTQNTLASDDCFTRRLTANDTAKVCIPRRESVLPFSLGHVTCPCSPAQWQT